MKYEYDICFMGGGLNYVGAVVASAAGLKTVLIEREMKHLGGTCLHNGCIPSKMFLHTAEGVLRSRDELYEGSLHIRMARLFEKKEKMLLDSTTAIVRQCAKAELIEGEAKLVAPHTVEIANTRLTAHYVLIGTGSKPFIPEGIDYDGSGVVTSDEVLNLKELPEKIAIYGDGAIGLEMASFFAAAGMETELIWRRERLLQRAHPIISAAMSKQMDAIGVKRLPERTIESAKTTKRGVHIRYENGEEHYVPHLLVATGRHADLSAVAPGLLSVGKQGIETDEQFETSLKEHYAVGDCNGKLQLAHAARAQVLYVVDEILGRDPEMLDLNHVVRFIHTLPMSYATVGMGKDALDAHGIACKEGVFPLRGIPYARMHDAEEGSMIVYADEEGFILGAEILAPNAEELISTVAMALAGEMDAKLAKRTILAHPTFSESLERAYGRL